MSAEEIGDALRGFAGERLHHIGADGVIAFGGVNIELRQRFGEAARQAPLQRAGEEISRADRNVAYRLAGNFRRERCDLRARERDRAGDIQNALALEICNQSAGRRPRRICARHVIAPARACGGDVRAAGDRLRQRAQQTQTLRNLQRDGLVARAVFPTVPPGVEYSLTPLGRSLLGPIYALAQWAEENFDAVRAARASFAAQAR